MKTRLRDGQAMDTTMAWYHVTRDVWVVVRVTRKRYLFGRHEYFVTPERGTGRWVSDGAIDFDLERIVP